ncbi:RHS repeat-associated core domain-containing protein [Actinoplanes sp. NPDC051861]|uniref:RHS repeat domain-containing protein n=1 Tax=Actinoplanes sp. NPDC051861 TaxID=3155170 RepID=UPI00344A9469
MTNSVRRRLAAAFTGLLAAGFLQATPAAADPAEEKRLKPHAGVSIGGRAVKDKPVRIPAMPTSTPEAPQWPAPGAAAASAASVRATDGKARRLPVEVLDRAAAARAHRDVVVRVRPEAAGSVDVRVDYSGFADAYGADWSDRLRLVSLPDCALTTPDAAACAATPLVSSNDGTAVSAAVPVTAQGAVVALEAGSSGGSGDFGATALSPSGTWNGGGNSGAFTWAYPMSVPPSLGGPAPSLSLNYSSQAVDGRTAATNNQPSWVGEGFSYEPGFIERRYASCADDNDDDDRPGNNSVDSGDQCWATDNATLSLNGIAAGELIYNATEKRWHVRSDDGVRIERLYGATNGDKGPSGENAGASGEHWVVTATNGTKYYFGLNRLPGWTANAAETKSVFTVPVAGNQSGEPCRQSGFKDSFCDQGWRWNLDWVVDTNGNAMSYWYSPEKNKYAKYGANSDVLEYVRAGNVTEIKYGQRSSSAYTTAPMGVAFGTAERCLSSCGVNGNWKDTPLDQECTGSTCTQYGPTFWSKRRLATITTQIANGTTPRNVDQWTLTHSWPDPTDGTRAGMWLSSIGHKGWDAAGAETSVPNVRLIGKAMDNRVDTTLSNGLQPMRWFRLKTIYTETGGMIDVEYKAPDCTAGSTPSPWNNTKRCFPVRWAPPDLGQAPGTEITDWFHKYVVESVTESDMTSPAEGHPLHTRTTYSYDKPAWRFADDDGITKDKYRTWSQWRGYEVVSVVKGDDGDRTRVDTRYFRGMNLDKSSPQDTVGSRRVTVTDSQNRATIDDADELSGFVRETVVYNGPGGAAVSGTISDPYISSPTASRKLPSDIWTVAARHVDTSGVWNWTALDNGRGQTWTHSTTEFDKYGMPTAVTDHGNTAKTGDEKCVLTDYTRNEGAAWLISFPSQVRTFALTCAEARKSGRVISAAEVIGATRTSFDGQAYGAAPTKGATTRTESLEKWENNAPVFYTTAINEFDDYGRPHFSWNALNHKTETTYTHNAYGQIVRVDVKNPLNWGSYTTLDPATGANTLSSDQNGRRTESLYDGLGRLISVWKPGRTRAANDVPHLHYEYSLNTNRASVVKAEVLNAAGKLSTSYTFYDSLLRPVQTQNQSSTVGMLVTDSYYDTAGRPKHTYGPYWESGTGVSATRWQPPMPAGRDNVESWTRVLYDGTGRETNKILFHKLAEKWRATTVYHGDYVDTYPPQGGTVESKHVDPLGRTTEIRQYHSRDIGGGFDSTKYGYNAKGQLETVTNPAGTKWTYGYDIQGRQNYTKDPDKGETTTTYDKLGRTETAKDGRGQVLAYRYDDLGRTTGLYNDSLTGTKLADWTYDTLTGGLGVLASSSRYVGTDAYTTATTLLDAKTGLPTRSTVTIPASETGLAGTYTYNARYAPDGTPSVTQMAAIGGTGGLGAETLTSGFSDLGAVTTLSTTNGGTLVPAVTFTEFGEPASVWFGNNGGKALQITNDYEPGTRRLAASEAFREVSPGVVSWKEYRYNHAGEIERTAELAPLAGIETQCWREDYLQRLTDAWTPSDGNCDTGPSLSALADTTSAPAPYWTSWSFNTAGNRAQQTEHKTTSGVRTTDYTYPTASAAHPHFVTGTTVTTGTNSVTSGYQSDAAGNTISRPTAANGQQTLNWNSEGRLATATDSSGTSSYIYDADGNRLIAKDSTGKTLYLPGQEVRVDNNGTVQSCTRYYTYGGKTVAQRTTKGLTWLVSDTQNTASISVDAVTQQATVRHLTAYGENRDGPSIWINDKGFLGKTLDKTGLTHIGAREYDTKLGRFVSVDPLMDLTDPQMMLGYAYANNSPVSSSDPTGKAVDTGTGNGDGTTFNPDNGNCLSGCVNDTDSDVDLPGNNQPPPGNPPNNGGGGSNSSGGGGAKAAGDNQQKKCSDSWWCRTKSWVSDHKADIAGFAAGVVVGGACTIAVGWTGVGAVACGAAAGAVSSITHDLVEGGHSAAEMAGNAIVGGVFGGVFGGAMFVGGKILGAGVRSIVSRVGASRAAGTANRAAGTANTAATNTERDAATETVEQVTARAELVVSETTKKARPEASLLPDSAAFAKVREAARGYKADGGILILGEASSSGALRAGSISLTPRAAAETIRNVPGYRPGCSVFIMSCRLSDDYVEKLADELGGPVYNPAGFS